MSAASTIATTSSAIAAGIAPIFVIATARAACPPYVPANAPIAPTIAPATGEPPRHVVMNQPAIAPLSGRMTIDGSAVRDGILGDASATYSPRAPTPRAIPQIPTPRDNASAASEVNARRPDTKPSPSAGSVYPTLQLLEDGGFVTSEQVDGKRVYTITESGRALLADRAADPDEDGDADEAPDVRHKLRESVMKFVAAVWNARHTDDATLARVRDIVDKARKDVYTILASDEA